MAFDKTDGYYGIAMELFDYLNSKKKDCDYLYVNHTNEFFSEYVDVKKSSR